MKTINFLTSHFLPENTACTNRVMSFVDELQKDYKINIICLTEKGKSADELIIQYTASIKIYYVNQKSFNGKNFIIRAFYEMFYIFKLLKISKNLSHDLLIATSPYMFMIPIIAFNEKGKKVLDIRDIVWEYLDNNSFIKKCIKNILIYIMSKSVQRFDAIIVTNGYELNILEKEYAIRDSIIIPNGIDRRRFEKLSSLETITNNNLTVTYVGNVGLAQNIKVLIDAAKILRKIDFLIIGDGIELESIKKYSNELCLKNVKFLGKLEWNMLEVNYKKSSILYAQLDEKYISAMPSKLYEYASVGLPIIYGGVGQACTFVKELENSIVINPNNVQELVAAIQQLENKNGMISKNNRCFVEKHYLREKASKKIFEVLNKL